MWNKYERGILKWEMLNHQTKIQNKTSGTMSCGIGGSRRWERSGNVRGNDQKLLSQRIRISARSSGRECCVGGGGDRFVSACVMVNWQETIWSALGKMASGQSWLWLLLLLCLLCVVSRIVAACGYCDWLLVLFHRSSFSCDILSFLPPPLPSA